jgi:hypothetical protein
MPTRLGRFSSSLGLPRHHRFCTQEKGGKGKNGSCNRTIYRRAFRISNQYYFLFALSSVIANDRSWLEADVGWGG